MLVPTLSLTQRTREQASYGSILLHKCQEKKYSHSYKQWLNKLFRKFILRQEMKHLRMTSYFVHLWVMTIHPAFHLKYSLSQASPPLTFLPLLVSCFPFPARDAHSFVLSSTLLRTYLSVCSCSFIKVQDWFLPLIYIVSSSRLSPRTEILLWTSQGRSCTCCYFEKWIIMRGTGSRQQLERDITPSAFKTSCNKPLFEKLLSVSFPFYHKDMHCLRSVSLNLTFCL